MARRFEVAGQVGWAHDEGHAAGTFCTFDALDLSPELPPRKVHVFLPRGWENGRRRYPVLYLNDGDTAFWRGGVAGQTWDVAGLLSSRNLPALAVVAVCPVDRDAEYTHVDWGHGRRPYGKLSLYADYLAGPLSRFIDGVFPTDARAGARVSGGSSHGGLAAFWTATRFPTRFGGAICMSSSFFSGLDSLWTGALGGPLLESPLVRDVASILSDAELRPRLWMCWGLRRDGGEHNSVVEALATERGREMAKILVEHFGYLLADLAGRGDLITWEDPSGAHDEASWRRRLPAAITALFGP